MRRLKFDRNNGAELARSLREIERIVKLVELDSDNTNGRGGWCDGLTLDETLSLLNALKGCLGRVKLPRGRPAPRRAPALRVIEGGSVSSGANR
jgi:hypothetical protein